MTDLIALGGLFLSALIAATLFPASSEAVLAGLAVSQAYPAWLLVAVASVGNIAGASINWAIGRFAAETRWVSNEHHLQKARGWFRRFGPWSLLLSWLPVLGDPLTFVAGILRLPFGIFLIPVAIGKVGRYVVIFLLSDWLTARVG